MHPHKLILSTRSQTQQTLLKQNKLSYIYKTGHALYLLTSHYFNQQEEKNTLRGQYVSMDLNMIIS